MSNKGGSPASTGQESVTKGRESIWKRSKRVLGVEHFDFLKQTAVDNSIDATSPKDDSKESPGKVVVSKRREQVRRAQKTHRQRTDTYLKALEAEVLRLKAVEVANTHEIKGLWKELAELKQGNAAGTGVIASGSSFTQQPGSQHDSQSAYGLLNDYSSTDWMMTLVHQDGNSALRADHLPKSVVQHSPGHTDHPYQIKTEIPAQIFSEQSNLAYWDNLAHKNSLANGQTALHFVLVLEQPCMTHLPEKMDTDTDTFGGHTLSASEAIMRQAPSGVAPQTTWPVDTTGINRLFSLSSQLNLDGEVTPVQAWNYIWQHSNAGRINAQTLEVLSTELKKIVSCYGFGAVMDEWAFKSVVESTLQI